MFNPTTATLPQGHNAQSRVRRSGRRKASRKDCLVAALLLQAHSHKSRLVIILSSLVMPRYRNMLQDVDDRPYRLYAYWSFR